jgi:hypothetical protein
MAAKMSVKRRDPAAELAETLVESLRAKKLRGEYPVSLRQLAESMPLADPALLAAALGKSQFTKAALLVKPPDKKSNSPVLMESPVGLLEDAASLAHHPSALAFVRAANPAATPAELKKWVNSKAAFKTAFADAVDQLAPAMLLKALRSQRALGEESYPLTIRSLAARAGGMADAEVAKAITHPGFFAAVVVAGSIPRTITLAAAKKLLDAPLALREDIDRLAGSELLIRHGIRLCRKPQDCAFKLEDIAKKVFGKDQDGNNSDLRSRFVRVNKEKLSAAAMPPSIGWIHKTKHALLFLIEDLLPKSIQPKTIQPAGGQVIAHRPLTAEAENKPRSAAPERTDASHSRATADDRFAARFAEAFARLDRENGSYNFVWLADLRNALSAYTREQFDAGIKQLRAERHYQINAGEGRSGISHQQREAAILEDGTIHTSVSRVKR